MYINLPDYLYHATYKPLLSKIKQSGLRGGINKFWDDSSPDVVYLSDDPNVAESYAETSDIVDEDWLDLIVILKIDISKLDPALLEIDDNNLSGDTYQYAGTISPDVIVDIYE